MYVSESFSVQLGAMSLASDMAARLISSEKPQAECLDGGCITGSFFSLMSSSRFLFSVPALIAGLFPVSVFAQAAALRQGVTSAANMAGLSGACSGTSCVTTIIGNVISIAVGFLGVLLLLYILYAGFLWTTSGGDTGQVDKAKNYIKNAIIGLVIVSLAFVISSFVLDQVARITNPASSVTPGAPPPPAG